MGVMEVLFIGIATSFDSCLCRETYGDRKVAYGIQQNSTTENEP